MSYPHNHDNAFKTNPIVLVVRVRHLLVRRGVELRQVLEQVEG
ncbi:hypothetical protein RintRC_7643 [Richelia intracellularis]|nr:hypothetical protein RintRC_7643 [Richelia intracellularis]